MATWQICIHGCFILRIDSGAAATADEGHLPTEPGKTGVQLSSESSDIYLHIKSELSPIPVCTLYV